MSRLFGKFRKNNVPSSNNGNPVSRGRTDAAFKTKDKAREVSPVVTGSSSSSEGGAMSSLFQGLHVSGQDPVQKQPEPRDAPLMEEDEFTESSGFSFISEQSTDQAEGTDEPDKQSRPPTVGSEHSDDYGEGAAKGSRPLSSHPTPNTSQKVLSKPRPSEEQPPEPRPTEEQPPEPRPTEEQPPEPRPTEVQPPEPRPTEEQPPEPRPSEEQPVLQPSSKKQHSVSGLSDALPVKGQKTFAEQKARKKKNKAVRPGQLSSDPRSAPSSDPRPAPSSDPRPAPSSDPRPAHSSDPRPTSLVQSKVSRAYGVQLTSPPLPSVVSDELSPQTDTNIGFSKEQGNTSIPSTSDQIAEYDAPTSIVDPASEDTPTTSEDTPTASEDTPTTSEDIPTASEDTPTTSEDTPTASEDTPTASEDTPTASEDTPTASEDTPTASEDTPTASEDTPTVDILASSQSDVTAISIKSQSQLSEMREKESKMIEECNSDFQTLNGTVVSIIEKRHQLCELKVKEDEALLQEDYELADQLKLQIEELSQVSDQNTSLVYQLVKVLPEIVTKYVIFLKTEENLRVELLQSMDQLKTKYEEAFQDCKIRTEDKMSKETEELKSLSSTLDVTAKNVEGMTLSLNAKETELSEEFEVETQLHKSNLEKLQSQQKQVESEIQELEEKLRKLRSQNESILKDISVESEFMQNAKQQFEDKMANLSNERRSLNEGQSMLEDLQAKHDRRLEAIGALKEEQEETEEMFEGVFKKVEELREEDQMRLTEMQALHQSITELNIEQLPGGSSSEELHSLRESEKEVVQSIQSLADQIVSNQEMIIDLQHQCSELKLRLPQLQEAKKAAVTGRNYKKAGSLSEELKTLTAKQTDLENILQEKLTETEKLTQELDTKKEELASVKTELSKSQSQEELEQFEHLIELKKKLESVHEMKSESLLSSLETQLDSFLKIFQKELKTEESSS